MYIPHQISIIIFNHVLCGTVRPSELHITYALFLVVVAVHDVLIACSQFVVLQ